MTKCKAHRKLVATFENGLRIFTIFTYIICKQVVIISSWKNIRRCNITRRVSVKSLLKSAILWNVKRAKLFLYTPCRHMGSSGVVSLILNTEVSGQHYPREKSSCTNWTGDCVLPRADLVILLIPLGIELRFVVPTHFPIIIPTTLSQSTNCPSHKTVLVIARTSNFTKPLRFTGISTDVKYASDASFLRFGNNNNVVQTSWERRASNFHRLSHRVFLVIPDPYKSYP